MERVFSRPQTGEYAPYTIEYISLVPDDCDLLADLANGAESVPELARSFTPKQVITPHAPGEWTVLDVLQHIIDTERVFSYRAMRIARGDKTALPGFEQEDYAASANANARTLEDLLIEYHAVRQSSIALIRSFSEEAWLRLGFCGAQPLSVRGAAYIIAGHELYHAASVRRNYC